MLTVDRNVFMESLGNCMMISLLTGKLGFYIKTVAIMELARRLRNQTFVNGLHLLLWHIYIFVLNKYPENTRIRIRKIWLVTSSNQIKIQINQKIPNGKILVQLFTYSRCQYLSCKVLVKILERAIMMRKQNLYMDWPSFTWEHCHFPSTHKVLLTFFCVLFSIFNLDKPVRIWRTS